MTSESSLPNFTELNDLSSEANGGKVLFATDDFFAPAENLLKEEAPIFKPNVYTDHGKWMDGWETRRKRISGHDWCIIKLGVPGVIHGIEIDTAFFTGNYAPKFSLQGENLENAVVLPERRDDLTGTAATDEAFKAVEQLKSESWKELISVKSLKSGCEETRHNYFPVPSNNIYTHLRLNIYPDGGIARLHVYGESTCNVKDPKKMIDLVSFINGGVCKGYSNAHYGHPRNIIRLQPGINMGDGWETARRLDRPSSIEVDQNQFLVNVPGSEWAVFKLGKVGNIKFVEVDTTHFKGNCPDSITIEGVLMKKAILWNSENIQHLDWQTILSREKLKPHWNHMCPDLKEKGPFSHVRVVIAPDGGISRVRIYGTIEEN
ncbi:hypothetical protein FQA39_LY01144 [Lamprigera yunnana]|nr:hypothetical protein FQA39_LY01144 [Lamprigera yunnana]